MPRTGDHPAGRSRISTALDVFAILVALVTAVIAITGGFSFFVSGYLISAHRFDRSLNVLLVVLALRLIFFGRGGRWHFLLSPSRLSGLRALVRTWCGRDRLEPSPAGRLPLVAPHTAWAFLGICAFAVL